MYRNKKLYIFFFIKNHSLRKINLIKFLENTNKFISLLKFYKYLHIRRLTMQDVKTYLSTAPVLATLWFGFLAGLLIEINRFFPDALIFPFF